MAQLAEIQNWLTAQSRDSFKSVADRQQNSLLVLFEGTSKEEKLRSANLLARETKKEVYYVDLSKVVSKYIDETEKTLSAIIKKAASKKWILFFDEADALFGKRTNVRDSHDKYANQEVSYLLQRLEAYPGLIFVSVNNKETLDEPFLRRVRFVVGFK